MHSQRIAFSIDGDGANLQILLENDRKICYYIV
mgnify:CR=1 FL=1